MTSNNQHKESTMFRDLTSYAFCLSDENGFVDASDFRAMAINFAIEREMDAPADLFDGDDDWMDAMESRVDAMALQAKVMEEMEAGQVLWAW